MRGQRPTQRQSRSQGDAGWNGGEDEDDEDWLDLLSIAPRGVQGGPNVPRVERRERGYEADEDGGSSVSGEDEGDAYLWPVELDRMGPFLGEESALLEHSAELAAVHDLVGHEEGSSSDHASDGAAPPMPASSVGGAGVPGPDEMAPAPPTPPLPDASAPLAEAARLELTAKRRDCFRAMSEVADSSVICEQLGYAVSASWGVIQRGQTEADFDLLGSEIARIRVCFNGKTLHCTCRNPGHRRCQVLLQAHPNLATTEAAMVRWAISGSMLSAAEHADMAKELKLAWRTR